MALPSAGLQLILQGVNPFTTGLTTAGKAVNSFTSTLGGSATSAVGNFTKALGNMATVAGGIVLAKLGQEVVDLGRQVVGLTIDYERQRTTLQGLLAVEAIREGQARDMGEAIRLVTPVADDLFRAYQKLAILSPFKSSDIINAREQLQIYGVTSERLDDLVPRLVDVGSLFGWSSDKMNLASLALGQIATKGKLTGEEVRQLATVGVPAIAAVADVLGITNAEAQKLVSKGALSAEQFFDIFMKWSAPAVGSAERFAKTLPGLVSSLADLKEIGLREFGKGFFDTQISSLDEFVQKLKGLVMPDTSTPRSDKEGNTEPAAGPSPLQNLGKQFGQAFNEVKLVIQGVLDVAKPFTDWIGVQLPLAMDFVVEHSTEFRGAFIAIAALFATGLGIAAIAALIAGLASPIGLITMAVGVLGAAWAGNWGDIQGKTAAVWSFLEPAFKSMSNWLGDNLPIATKALSNVWTGTLKPALDEVWSFIKGSVIPVLSDLKKWVVGELVPAVKDLTDAFSRALGPALTIVAGILNVTLVPALKILWGFITDFVWPIVKTLASAIGTGLLQSIRDTTQKLNDFTEGWRKLQSFGESAERWLDGFYTWLSSTWNAGVTKAAQLVGTLASAFQTVSNKVSDGIAMVNDFISAISNISIPTLDVNIDWPDPPDWYCDLFGCSPKPAPMHQKLFVHPVFTMPEYEGGGTYRPPEGRMSPPIGMSELASHPTQTISSYTNAPQFNYSPVYQGAPRSPISDFSIMRMMEGGR